VAVLGCERRCTVRSSDVHWPGTGSAAGGPCRCVRRPYRVSGARFCDGLRRVVHERLQQACLRRVELGGKVRELLGTGGEGRAAARRRVRRCRQEYVTVTMGQRRSLTDGAQLGTAAARNAE